MLLQIYKTNKVTKINFSYFNFVKFFFFLILNFFYKFLNGFLLKRSSIYIYIDFVYLILIVSALKNSSVFKLTALMDLFAVDFPTKIDKRFELNYCFLSHFYCFRFILKTYCSVSSRIITLTKIFSSAQWFEREVWDMFGIKFVLHYNLKRILTDYSFHGHPLRKDFPVWGFIDLRYDDVVSGVTYEYEEFAQIYKHHFIFDAGWIKIYNSGIDLGDIII